MLNTMHEAAISGRLSNYTSAECVDMYSTTFVRKALNVLLVSSHNNTSNNSVLYSNGWNSNDQIPYWWTCGDTWDPDPYTRGYPVCTPSAAQAVVSSWKIHTYPISYCMVEVVEEECQLSFSLLIIAIRMSQCT